MKIVKMEELTTKKGDTMLKAMFEVVKGDDKGRKVFENYLVTHSNPKAVELNFRKLKEIATATGTEKEYETVADVAADVEEFLEIPVMVELGIRDPYTNAQGVTRTDNHVIKVTAR